MALVPNRTDGSGNLVTFHKLYDGTVSGWISGEDKSILIR